MKKRRQRKIIEIIWTGILFLIFLYFTINYIKTKKPSQIIGMVIFIILTLLGIVDLYLQNKNPKTKP